LVVGGCAALGDDSEESGDALSGPPEPTTYPNPGIERATFKGFDGARITSPAAKRGLDKVFAGRGFHVALPTASLRAAERLGHIAEFARGTPERVGLDTAQRRYAAYGKLPSPPGRNAPRDTPLGTSIFERRGVELTNTNCFSCHAGTVRGQVVAGLGNHDVDQVPQLADLQKLIKAELILKADAALRPLTILREVEELNDFFANAKGTVVPTYRFAEARGDNMGPFAVWKRLSRLENPSAKGLEELDLDERTARDDLFESVILPAVDPQPWWTRKYRTTNYAWAESSAHVAAHFAFNFTTPHDDVNTNHAEHVADIADILEFAKQTTSPAFPDRLEAEKVGLGRDIFHGKTPLANGRTIDCSSCHGSYAKASGLDRVGGWTVRYPNNGVVDVGTDPAYSDIVRKFTPLAAWGSGMKEYFARAGKPEIAPQVGVPNKRGYAAPVLVGVWASAPYFHNGSVPTLYSVLNSSARPAIWSRPTDNAFAYSTVRVGLAFQELRMSDGEHKARANQLASQDVLSPERVAFRAIYNTRDYGRSNAGHTFGDGMTDDERFAVIEFLKSLSGDDMPAAQ
jgi:cytochrome c peroxidase